MNNGIGKPVRRKEDVRLVTGRGEFSDDINAPGQAHAIVLRSPHAHARIRSIDSNAALAMPGVLAVLTGRDYVADGHKPIFNNSNPRDVPIKNFDGRPLARPPDFPLAVDKVRHAGEGVALIVAQTRADAVEAAEHIAVEYEPLPAVVEIADALKPGAPLIWDEAPGNVCADGDRGDKAAVERAFAGAAHVTRMEIRNNRVTGLPLEPASALGIFDNNAGRYTLRAGGQGVLIQKRALCGCFGVGDDKVRVICRDVGGGFGTKNLIYREYVLVCWAAQKLGRPVKWRGERSEAFFFDPYGRDLNSVAELALDADGKFLAVRTHNIQNLGSQTLHLVPLARGAAVTNGVYAIPAVYARLQAVFTNTTPTSTYRGAGRPEAMFVIERLIDTAAAEMGIDRVELRRRNFIQPAMLPYVNAMTTRYDSGEFDANMMRALALIDAKNFSARRKEAKKRGRYRGLGFGNYIETATGIPPERAVIKVLPQRQADDHARHAGERARTRDGVRAAHHRLARRAVRRHRIDPRRQRRGDDGQRLAFVPLDAARRPAARARRGRGARQGQAARRRRAAGGCRHDRVCRRALPRRRHGNARSDCTRLRRCRPNSTSRSLRSRPRPRSPPCCRRSRTAATPARSRSIRRPAP